MKTYFRILSFGSPFGIYIPQYIVYTLLYVVFSIFNIALLIPLLDVLFNQVDQTILTESVKTPEFNLSIEYIKDFFNFKFGNVIRESGRIEALKVVCIVIVIASLLANLFRYLISLILAFVRANVIKNIREDIYASLTSLHVGYFTEKRKGDIVSRVTNDVQQIEATVVNSLKVLLREPLLIVGYFVFLFSLSSTLTFYTILLLPISGGIMGIITKRLRLKARMGQDSLGKITNAVEESLKGVRLIKAFTAQNSMIKRFGNEVRRYARISISMSKRVDLAGPFSEFMGIAVVAWILYIGGVSVLENNSELTAAQFITFIIVFARILQPAKAVANAYSLIQRGLAAGERIFETIDSIPEIKDSRDAIAANDIQSDIEFENVSFSYENSKIVLDNINLKIKKGRTVALIGPSGGGKSTLADLVPRFYDPTQGSVKLDGTDLRKFTLDSIRAQMGIVTQESILFNDTIANNIAFGKNEYDLDEVENAAKIANAHEFILQTENGYQTVIGEEGSKLSGGQKQRLSIARAILKNPTVLILDEATSALDSESEKLVQDALSKLMKDRTSIVIAHRLSTIKDADEIVVIDDGRIVEKGTHQELMNSNGVYKKLSSIQKQ